jgi:hypothetical protein
LGLWLTLNARAETTSLPLQKFTSLGSMEIRCVSGGQNISFPIPERWDVRKASVSLRYTVSNNLIGAISQMVIKLNGNPIGQVKLNPLAPVGTVDLALPRELLETGYNDLTFQVAQHYQTNSCEQPCAPDLWTNISLSQSFINIDYELKTIPLGMGSAVAMTFDPKQFSDVTVNLVADSASAEAMTFAGLIASGIARHFDYREVRFTHSPTIKPGVDNMLIGTTTFANQVLDQYRMKLPAGEGGLIKVQHLPHISGSIDKQHALISVTGDEVLPLKIAAQTFTNMSLPYPGTDELRAFAFNIPDISMYGGRQVLATDKLYEFKDLGMASYTFQGQTGKPGKRGYTGSSELAFRLPPDFLIKQNQYAKLSLNFAYAAGLRNDSTVTITVNGVQVRDIHLDKVGGNFIEGYKIDLPTYLFKPGGNVISFRPYLNTTRQVCDVAITEGLFVSIFENSTLLFPPMPHFVEMPKLELFALNGFPFTKWPDGYQTLVYVPQPRDSTAIDTALNLIGLISQRNGFPLFGTQISFTEPKDWEGEMLVVGKSADIPKSIFERAPMQPDGIGTVPYPINRSWDSETTIARSKQLSGLGEGSGLLMQFESANKRGRSVVVATAQNEKDLRVLGIALLQSGILARITGDLNIINLNVPQYDVVSLSVGSKYSTGNKENASVIDALLFSNPITVYLLIALVIAMISAVAYFMLRRHRESRPK